MTTRMYRTVQRPPDRLPPSVVHYAEFQAAFEFYREQLFDGELNDCLIVMARNPRTHGYLAPHRWDTGRGGTMHELGMNPLDFSVSTTEDILSTLVHEMCHAWQFDAGEKKPRPKYHNKEWADRMEEIGLIPSHTGEPGGRRTQGSVPRCHSASWLRRRRRKAARVSAGRPATRTSYSGNRPRDV